MLIERNQFLNYFNTETSGIHRVYDDGSGARLRGGPMQDHNELWHLLKRIEENINEVGPIHTIMELGVADGGGMKIWEQILLSPNNPTRTKDKSSLTYIGIDYKPNPLWECQNSPVDIRTVSGDTHSISTRIEVKKILTEKKINNVDFLWIDAQHWSIDVEKDMIDYGEFVRDNGIIAFHDTRLCRSFWDRFTGACYDASHPDGHYGETEDKIEKMVFHKEEIKYSLGTGIFWKLPNQNVINFK